MRVADMNSQSFNLAPVYTKLRVGVGPALADIYTKISDGTHLVRVAGLVFEVSRCCLCFGIIATLCTLCVL